MSGINHERVVGHGDKGTHEDWNKDHKQKGNHDCEKFQHLNHVLENRTSYPAGPVPGQIIFRSDFPNAFVWTGTMWVSLTPVATVVVAADGTGNFLTIQEGIDALPVGGGVVYVKEGTYSITAAITISSSHVSVIGAGTCTKITTISDIKMFNITAEVGIYLNKLYIYGDITKANNIGVYMDDIDALVMRDCRIENCGSHGVSAESGSYNLFSGCLVHRNNGDGIHLDGTVAAGGVYTISESQVSTNAGTGIYTNCIRQIRLADNEISFNEQYGIHIIGEHTSITTGNTIVMNYWDGIRVDTQLDVIINNNIISACGFLNGGAGHGIMLISIDDGQVSNNVLSNNQGWDINISNAGCVDTIVLGNRCEGIGVGAINDAGTGTELGHNKEG